MISDPKVGDVVYLDPYNQANWVPILTLGERYQIVSVVEEITMRNFAVRLRCMRTGELMLPKGDVGTEPGLVT